MFYALPRPDELGRESDFPDKSASKLTPRVRQRLACYACAPMRAGRCERRRSAACASRSNTFSDVSQSMQPSVMLCP